MKFVQRLFMGIGALAAVAALLTVVSPKAHALAATLVEVVNTRSTPVPNQDVDHPGRHPYQQSCFSNVNQGGIVDCIMPTVVPANTEVVIQTVSMILGASTPPQYSQLITFGGGTALDTYIPLVAQTNYYMATQPLNQYADPGSQIECATALTGTGAGGFTCAIAGYTVSLP